jgi:hypothetical protein
MEESALPTGTGRTQRDRVTGLHFEGGLQTSKPDMLFYNILATIYLRNK